MQALLPVSLRDSDKMPVSERGRLYVKLGCPFGTRSQPLRSGPAVRKPEGRRHKESYWNSAAEERREMSERSSSAGLLPVSTSPLSYFVATASGANFASFNRSATFSPNGLASNPEFLSCPFSMKTCRIVSVCSKTFFPSLSVSQ